MGKDKDKKQSIEAPADGVMREHQLDGDEQSREEQAEQVSRAAADDHAGSTHRVEVLVAVNGHVAHDKVRVEKDHPFYSGLLMQNLARVID